MTSRPPVPACSSAPRDDVDALRSKAHADELVGAAPRPPHAPRAVLAEHRTTAAGPRAADRGRPAPAAAAQGHRADLRGRLRGEPVVGLRADIDALPLADEKDVPYRSTVPGVCHACGHDVHTAILLGAALVLAEQAAAGQLPGASG